MKKDHLIYKGNFLINHSNIKYVNVFWNKSNMEFLNIPKTDKCYTVNEFLETFPTLKPHRSGIYNQLIKIKQKDIRLNNYVKEFFNSI